MNFGRAVLEETSEGVRVWIPVDRGKALDGIASTFAIIFLGFIGIIILGRLIVTIVEGHTEKHLFGALLMVGLFLSFVIQNIMWERFGKEELIITDTRMTIDMVNQIGYRKCYYDLDKVRNIRVVDRPYDPWGAIRRGGPLRPPVILFDYGPINVRFGIEINEVEARQVMQYLLKKAT
jgi:hypothetical protein